ncbi:DUF4252 domain-containing protein [Kaistella antarctica]|uniref:Protein of uncharacterized function (DUF2807) n=1 Tax=Kaistella antarctica TaxID=266748 RepID=A0A448NUB4_9FLAO|nr:DUF4252 domain-containing protein [Kaistella antarctica]SEV85915.1 Putative auto-transporter adhesin, head GIN domain [Kaistella antarctica]VEI01235.1 Protein of uncharacterised function (DUF2807) [Kaistella antarctica]
MKKILLIFALLFSYFAQVNAQKDKLDQLFEKYQETEGVTSIKIAKPMFNMLNKLNIADEELAQIKPLLSKINGLKILIIEKSDNEKQLPQFQKLQADISSSIKSMKYEELITVHSKDNKIKFLSSDATNGILDNLLLSINAEGNTLLMMLDGKISMDDVNNLINEAEKSATKSSVTTENINSNGVTQVRNVGKFTGVSVSSGIKVNFTQGNNQSVVVETDPNLQEYVSTEIENGILVISIKNKANRKLTFKKLLVTIEGPQLSLVTLSSGSLFTTLNTIIENDFQASITSGANLNADLNIRNKTSVSINSGSSMRMDVKTKNFNLTGTSGSSSTVVGNAENTTFSLSSAATCNAQDLVSKNGTASASSGANLKMNTTENLTASASSGAYIRYKGDPRNVVQSGKSSSGGSVKPLN